MTRSVRNSRLGMALLLITLSACLGIGMQFLESRTIRHILGGNPPTLFYRSLEGDLLGDYGGVIGIAHNAGNSRASTSVALIAGADGIEVDITAIDDHLYATHSIVPVWIGNPETEPLRIIDAWNGTRGTQLIQFDFKSTSPEDVRKFIRWLENHHDDRVVIVTTRTYQPQATLKVDLPWVVRFLSIGTQEELEAFQQDRAALDYIQGVAINEKLLDGKTIDWLHDHDLLIIAWTVNRVDRVNELVREGVDAITTDNLAILELLSHDSPEDLDAVERVSTSEATDCPTCERRTNPLLAPIPLSDDS